MNAEQVQLITTDEAAEFLGLNTATVYQLLENDPTFPKPVSAQGLRFSIAELRLWRSACKALPTRDDDMCNALRVLAENYDLLDAALRYPQYKSGPVPEWMEGICISDFGTRQLIQLASLAVKMAARRSGDDEDDPAGSWRAVAPKVLALHCCFQQMLRSAGVDSMAQPYTVEDATSVRQCGWSDDALLELANQMATVSSELDVLIPQIFRAKST